jgi:predicted ATPase with chaperone activity
MSTEPLITPLPIDGEEMKFVPPVAENLEDLGVPASMVEQLILKILYFRGDTPGRVLASSLGVNFSVIEMILENLKRQHLLMVKSSLGMGSVSAIFTLTENARNMAREYLETNQYAGRIPVPLEQYVVGVKMQRQKGDWLSKDMLRKAYRHMVVSDQILSQIGPAVNAGKSFLIYGQPGNGKTFLAEALFNIDSDPIYIPFAIEYQGHIIQIHDPIYHQRLDEDAPEISAFHHESKSDGRWFQSKRPFIVTGGELSLEMLDLSFNPASKVYDAPFQLKANNGIYLIDDFGRQKASPAEILNRWIVPMERRIDFLTFRTGGKAQVPFECFLVFSTNLRPQDLGDEAFLRRIQYKMFLRSPNEMEFMSILERYVQSQKLEYDRTSLEEFLDRHYRTTKKKLRRCHPRDVVSHAIDLIRFERLPYKLTREVLDRAFDMTFVSEEYET